jgi:hypothetical protein
VGQHPSRHGHPLASSWSPAEPPPCCESLGVVEGRPVQGDPRHDLFSTEANHHRWRQLTQLKLLVFRKPLSIPKPLSGASLERRWVYDPVFLEPFHPLAVFLAVLAFVHNRRRFRFLVPGTVSAHRQLELGGNREVLLDSGGPA